MSLTLTSPLHVLSSVDPSGFAIPVRAMQHKGHHMGHNVKTQNCNSVRDTQSDKTQTIAYVPQSDIDTKEADDEAMQPRGRQ